MSSIPQNCGCDEVADEIQGPIRGEVWQVQNSFNTAPNQWLIGSYRGMDSEWFYHSFVVKDGWAYDAFTGPEGEPLSQYESEFGMQEDLTFGPK